MNIVYHWWAPPSVWYVRINVLDIYIYIYTSRSVYLWRASLSVIYIYTSLLLWIDGYKIDQRLDLSLCTATRTATRTDIVLSTHGERQHLLYRYIRIRLKYIYMYLYTYAPRAMYTKIVYETFYAYKTFYMHRHFIYVQFTYVPRRVRSVLQRVAVCCSML